MFRASAIDFRLSYFSNLFSREGDALKHDRVLRWAMRRSIQLLQIRPLPLIRKLLNLAWFGHGLQGFQRIQKNAPLAFHVARFPEHAAPGELDKERPGRFDVGHPVGRVAHGDGRKSRFFRHPLNQTHGLMTLGSDRHQEEDVHPFGFDPREEPRDRLCDQGHDIIDIAEAIMRIRHLADDPFIFQFDDAVNGKDRVDVLRRQAVVVMGMSNAELFLADGLGDLPKGCVAVN
jgi:hypothetical protein